jgi:hypothetical protein
MPDRTAMRLAHTPFGPCVRVSSPASRQNGALSVYFRSTAKHRTFTELLPPVPGRSRSHQEPRRNYRLLRSAQPLPYFRITIHSRTRLRRSRCSELQSASLARNAVSPSSKDPHDPHTRAEMPCVSLSVRKHPRRQNCQPPIPPTSAPLFPNRPADVIPNPSTPGRPASPVTPSTPPAALLVTPGDTLVSTRVSPAKACKIRAKRHW